MELEKTTRRYSGLQSRLYDDACGTALALEFIGERWSLLVMRELAYGPRRFGEIRANLPGISANVLTQRLQSLEQAGILARHRLGSPANVQVYALTPWGEEARVLIRELGRWAARSPLHDPFLFMSPASAMMSLQTLGDPARAARPMLIGFAFPADAFAVRVADGRIEIERGEADGAEATFAGDTMAMRVTIYGKAPLGSDRGMTVTGDFDTARAFVDLFRLPEKVA